MAACLWAGCSQSRPTQTYILRMQAKDPGRDYKANPSEKDTAYAIDSLAFRFTDLTLTLPAETDSISPRADFTFRDKQGAILTIPQVNLITLIPKLDTRGEYQYPEFLMEEFERVGVTFDRDEGEFSLELPASVRPEARRASARAWRVGIWNNCLDPTKWEMILYSRYYLDTDTAHADHRFRARYRTLAHVWFYLDKALYADLVLRKNPHLAIDIFKPYDFLNTRARQVPLAPDSLRRLGRELKTEMVEVGHKSNRKLEEINSEQWYKKRYKIIMNRQHFYTYREIVERPVWLAPFQDRGFYEPKDTVKFDYGWLKQIDRIRAHAVAAPGPLRYLELTLDGPESDYRIVMGNLDLAQLNEHKLFEMSFGIDPMPRTARHWAGYDPTGYRLDSLPETVKPFMFIQDARTGKWANNQLLGLDKAYIGWESPERRVLWVYLVTYERVISVWMGRVRLMDPALEAERIANARFAPGDSERYPPPEFAAVRKQREAENARITRFGGKGDTVVLDFESLRHEDDRLLPHGCAWQEKGFLLTAAGFAGVQPFRSLGTRGYMSTGSAALIHGIRNGINILRKRDETIAESIDEENEYFDLLSLDLAEFSPGAGAALTFIGVRRDSSLVTRSVRLDGKPGAERFDFHDFKDLVQVRWVSRSTQVDNIRVRYRPRMGRAWARESLTPPAEP